MNIPTDDIKSNRPEARIEAKLHTLHPLSLVFECLSIVRSNLLPFAIAGLSAASGGLIGMCIALTAAIIAISAAVFKFVTYRYSVNAGELVIDHGYFFKYHRTIPIDRIQNIDLVQNLIHRLLGVGEVRIETASGREPEAVMRVLAVRELAALRTAVFEQHTEVDSAQLDLPAQQANETMETAAKCVPVCVYAIPTQLVLLAGFLSNRGTVIAGILLGAIWEFRFLDRLGINFAPWIEAKSNRREQLKDEAKIVGGMYHWVRDSFGTANSIVLLLGVLLGAWLILKCFSSGWYILRFYGYRLEKLGDDLRVQCGLFTRVSATIPRDRIQLVSIHRTFLGRLLGIASIRLETEGGGSEDEDAAKTIGRRWFLPAILDSDVKRVLSELHPGLEWDVSNWDWRPLSPKAATRMRRMAIFGCSSAILVGLFLQPLWGWSIGLIAMGLAIGYANKKAKSKRFAVLDWGVVFRSGLFYRKLSFCLFDKIQGVSLNQSLFDRRWNMATLALDTASSGPAEHRIEIPMLDAAEAGKSFDLIRNRCE